MNSRITVEPGGNSFDCRSGQSLLSAAISNNIAISYGCSSGFCGSCKVRLNAGKIEYRHGRPEVLSNDDANQGYVIACQAYPVSDLRIGLPGNPLVDAREVKSLPVRVLKLERLTPNVMLLVIRLPVAESFFYDAGQWVNFIFENAYKVPLSIANAPNDDHQLEFHITDKSSAIFWRSFSTSLVVGGLMRIEGPYGGFTVRDTSRPVLLLADGSGFAAVKALLEEILKMPGNAPIHLFYGARQGEDLYQCRLIPDQHVNSRLRVDEVIYAGEGGQGISRQLALHEAVLNKYPGLSEYCVYIAGSPQLIATATIAFINAGIDPAALYSESLIQSERVS